MLKDDLALLGKTEEGDRLYLERASYDCGWYYGFGYLKVFEKDQQKWSTYTHWDSWFTGSEHVRPKNIKEKLDEVKLSDRELWVLCDLMKTFYSLQSASGVYERKGSSHLTGDTHGMWEEDRCKKMKVDLNRDTERIIREVQDLVGMDEPELIKSSPFKDKKDSSGGEN